MSKLEEFLKENPSLNDSQLLSSEDQEQLEGGACSASCRKACTNGCMVTQIGGSGQPGEIGLPGDKD